MVEFTPYKKHQHISCCCVAHRGGGQPENTLITFEKAVASNIEAIELDVQQTKDGVLVVFHDNDVDMLTDGHGNLLDLTLKDLENLRVNNQKIPTLKEVLDVIHGRKIYLEIKQSARTLPGSDKKILGSYPHIVDHVLKEIESQNMTDQVMIISFDWLTLFEVKQKKPQILTGMLVDHNLFYLYIQCENEHTLNQKNYDKLLKWAKYIKCDCINLDYHLLGEDDTVIRNLQSACFQVGVWTVNSFSDMLKYLSWGVTSITTDYPNILMNILNQKK